MMIEPLFAPGSSIWTGGPASALSWFQPQLALGNRVAGPSGSAFSPSPFVTSSSQLPMGLSTGVPSFATPELSAPGLAAAVAMRRGQPGGPTNDQEVEDFLYDAFELLTGTSDVEVRCEGGRITLAGSVTHKRLKHDLGEIVWALPIVADVQNNIAITTRRRSRPGLRESEPQASVPSRKQA